ncbi:MAG: hypothetical protein AB1505_28450, partial [Candidatus Latescibacterota bacterium]
MLSRHGATLVAAACWAAVLAPAAASAEVDYGERLGARTDGGVAYRTTGPGTLLRTAEPQMRKQYMPQELYQEFRWRTWDYTNYAGSPYKRYVEPALFGDYFYDYYGNFLTRGWLVYSWTQEHPRVSEGSQVLKRGEYAGFFRSLIIASDQKGQHSFSISVGDEIATTLTPMTFRKSVFNGAQVDYMSDRLGLTGIFSRISSPGHITDPNPGAFNAYTNLVGGRGTLRLHDSVVLGGVFVNAHNGRGTLETGEDNPFKGALTSEQLMNQVTTVVIRLTDDSPADEQGGATLLADDVEVHTSIAGRDTVLLGSQIGFVPQREGGQIVEGVRAANGNQAITLRYELDDVTVILDDRDALNNVRDLRFRLVLVNDYRVEITSDRQTNVENQPVFLLVTQASGNVRDGSNRRQVVFNYGLPTATNVAGLTLEVNDLAGFDLYTEFDVNHQYRQYPNRRVKTNKSHAGVLGDEDAKAWTLNLTQSRYPWFLSAEGFYIDEDYNTSPFIVDGNGRVDYADPTRSIYDFVDDNDDQDRKPDQERRYQDPRTGEERAGAGRSAGGFADEAVFPGWDQNNDFISDFNQNSNLFRENRFPDYEEPFLRYGSDRPEFLFGIDLNNNGWVDQFENDNLPDYPYKRDQKGYNVFVRNHLTPELQVTAGRTDQRLLSADRRNQTNYAVLAFERDIARVGQVRVFDLLKSAEDDIQDDLFQWVQEAGRPGGQREIADPLFAQDTWINALWLGLERQTRWGVNLANKLKYETVRQRGNAAARGFEENTRLLGVVNKVDYLRHLGSLTLHPKLKSELLLDDTPYSKGVGIGAREEWAGILFLTAKYPLLRRTVVEMGVEQMLLADLLADEGSLARRELTGDLTSTV